MYVVFKLVYACSHVCGYMGRPTANTKGSPLYLPSQGLSERAALRYRQLTLLWRQRQAAMPTRLLYAGARELNSCPHTCVVSTLSTSSQPSALRLASRTALNFRSSCLHCLSARIRGMDYQYLVYVELGVELRTSWVPYKCSLN